MNCSGCGKPKRRRTIEWPSGATDTVSLCDEEWNGVRKVFADIEDTKGRLLEMNLSEDQIVRILKDIYVTGGGESE